MKDNSTNTAVEMTTEEFHRLLEENVSLQAESRSAYQSQLTDLQDRYTKAIDQIIEEEKTALDTFRKARADFERAKAEYDDAMRYLAKMRNNAGRTYNERKAQQAGLFALRNNELQSERHNIFERFRDSGGQFLDDASQLLHPYWWKREKKGVTDETEA